MVRKIMPLLHGRYGTNSGTPNGYLLFRLPFSNTKTLPISSSQGTKEQTAPLASISIILNCKRYKKVACVALGRSSYNNFITSPQGCFQGWQKTSPQIRAVGKSYRARLEAQVQVSHMAGQIEKNRT
uniref:Hypothetical_protein n=1 Tax=Oryza brachyantha TaxID=4533 RepID=G2XM29_ORYBR|nr:hypothetical_protein [Oryza brachyantha]